MAPVSHNFDLSLANLRLKGSQEVDIAILIEQLVNNDPVFYSNVRPDLVTQSQPWGFSLQHVESVKSMQDNLNTLALIVRISHRIQ